jgi:LPS sulfotransferase NodH
LTIHRSIDRPPDAQEAHCVLGRGGPSSGTPDRHEWSGIRWWLVAAPDRRVPCRDVDSYLICATPRSGSTLLCGLLRSTGIAGRPESYFRRDDLGDYADRWGIPQAVDGAVDTTYVRAAVAAGRTPNGVFGARVMWGTMTELTDALRHAAHGSTASDVELLTEAFGNPRFVHLRRDDPVAQAVSWARAEQTQFWHPGDQVAPSGHQPHFDRDLIGGLVDTITAHEAAWQAWFTHHAPRSHPARGRLRGAERRPIRRHTDRPGVPRPRSFRRRHHHGARPSAGRRPQRRLDLPLPRLMVSAPVLRADHRHANRAEEQGAA